MPRIPDSTRTSRNVSEGPMLSKKALVQSSYRSL
jgi:hypothetical protein